MGDDKDGKKGSKSKLKRKAYEKALAKLQAELVNLQEWVKLKGLKVCIVFEGRDGAGKGGTIKAITERVSPRVFRVVALPAPTERERSQMYSQRYMAHFPSAGEIVIFDRSWYNRAGVERVMGFCTEKQAREFLQIVPAFEKLMVSSGIHLLKYWLEVSEEEQTRRLEARDEMFAATDTAWAPWYVARSDDKRRARLNIIRHLLASIDYKAPPRTKVKLPKRQEPGRYREPDYPYKFVPEKY